MGRPTLLSHLIPAAADRDPGAPALACGEDRRSYGEVVEAVARMAGALRANGVGPGDRVVVGAPKSADTFVAMHAALHVGAIAAPLDPFMPPGLLAAAVADLRPAAAHLSPRLAALWPDDHPVVATAAVPEAPGTVGVTSAAIATAPVGAPHAVRPDDPAYVITTSGSTGRPKSIVHTHDSGRWYAELAADCFGLTASDRMANVAPFHFDQSTFELYSGPLVGAAVVLVPDVLLKFPADLGALIETEAVTTWYSVPTILRQLLDRGALETRDLSSLRWVLFGGEVFPPAQLRRLMAAMPGARFSNVYGPAEVNQCTFHHLDAPPVDDTRIPIGRAWDHTELRLDTEDGLALEGPAVGELLVRTPTTMTGYWRQPALSAQSLVPADDGGRSWYRTGDLVERDAAGVHTFLGRADRQVKVQGVRIELESVEAAMGSIGGVTGSAAIVVGGDDPELVAVVESASIGAAGEILAQLRDHLPPAATPKRIVIVASLPRTTSGKIDVNRAADLIDTGVPS